MAINPIRGTGTTRINPVTVDTPANEPSRTGRTSNPPRSSVSNVLYSRSKTESEISGVSRDTAVRRSPLPAEAAAAQPKTKKSKGFIKSMSRMANKVADAFESLGNSSGRKYKASPEPTPQLRSFYDPSDFARAETVGGFNPKAAPDDPFSLMREMQSGPRYKAVPRMMTPDEREAEIKRASYSSSLERPNFVTEELVPVESPRTSSARPSGPPQVQQRPVREKTPEEVRAEEHYYHEVGARPREVPVVSTAEQERLREMVFNQQRDHAARQSFAQRNQGLDRLQNSFARFGAEANLRKAQVQEPQPAASQRTTGGQKTSAPTLTRTSSQKTMSGNMNRLLGDFKLNEIDRFNGTQFTVAMEIMVRDTNHAQDIKEIANQQPRWGGDIKQRWSTFRSAAKTAGATDTQIRALMEQKPLAFVTYLATGGGDAIDLAAKAALHNV